MKINLKVFVLLAMVLSVVVVSGCAQQPAQNQTTTTPTATKAPVKIESNEEASKAVVDTSKDVKQISDTLAGIDKALGGK